MSTPFGQHVRLVQPSESHAPQSVAWVSSIDVVQYMGADFPNPTLEGEKQRIRDMLAASDEHSWMIEVDGTIVGNVAIRNIREGKTGKTGSVTILIGDKNFWRRGIATQACKRVIGWAKSSGFGELTARALQENVACMAMLTKIGFIETGTEPYDGLVHGMPSIWHNFSMSL